MKNILKKTGAFLRRSVPSGLAFTVLLVLAVFLANLLLVEIGRITPLAVSFEKGEDLSLSGATDVLFEDARKAGKTVTVTFCTYEANVAAHETGRYVLETARGMAERYPDLFRIRFVNLLTKLDENGRPFDFTPYETDPLGREVSLTQTSVLFDCEGNTRALVSSGYADFFTITMESGSAVISAYNGEETFAATALRVMSTAKPRRAYFTSYHGESIDSVFASLLTAAGYYLDVIDLRDPDADAKLADADLVLICAPKADFERAAEGSDVRSECEKLDTYLRAGGSLYVAIDPYVARLGNLESLLGGYGLGMLYHETADHGALRTLVKDTENAITLDSFTLVAEYAPDERVSALRASATAASDGGILLRETAVVIPTGDAYPVLLSSAAATAEAGGATVSRDGSYPIAAAAPVGEGNVFLVASAYLTASDAVVAAGYSNKDFLYSLFENLFSASEMPYGCPLVRYQTQTLENLTMGTARRYMAVILALPVALAVAGAVILIRRKNR